MKLLSLCKKRQIRNFLLAFTSVCVSSFDTDVKLSVSYRSLKWFQITHYYVQLTMQTQTIVTYCINCTIHTIIIHSSTFTSDVFFVYTEYTFAGLQSQKERIICAIYICTYTYIKTQVCPDNVHYFVLFSPVVFITISIHQCSILLRKYFFLSLCFFFPSWTALWLQFQSCPLLILAMSFIKRPPLM